VASKTALRSTCWRQALLVLLWLRKERGWAFVTEQATLARARAMIRDADRRRGIPAPEPAADAAADLADHAVPVLARTPRAHPTAKLDPS
jgi:hypothetical protein